MGAPNSWEGALCISYGRGPCGSYVLFGVYREFSIEKGGALRGGPESLDVYAALYRSTDEPVRLSDGVPPAIFENGPTSRRPSLPEPVDAASLSSPTTKLLNFAHIDPETFSILGFEIQEPELSFGDCCSRFVRSSKIERSPVW